MSYINNNQKNYRYISGIKGEDLAIEYFKKNGFFCIERRYKTKNGEIDVIFINEKTKMIVFVEVKRRKKIYDYDGVITKKQWNRIYNASMDFIQLHTEYSDYIIRYDAFICFSECNNPIHIENILITDNIIE